MLLQIKKGTFNFFLKCIMYWKMTSRRITSRDSPEFNLWKNLSFVGKHFQALGCILVGLCLFHHSNMLDSYPTFHG